MNKAWVAVAAFGLVAVVIFLWPGGDDALPENAAAIRSSLADDPYMGDPTAEVVLIGFESPFCSGCQYFHGNTLPGLKERFFDTGGVVYYYANAHWGSASQEKDGAVAQDCAYEHGGNDLFWAFADAVYAPGNFSYTSPPDYGGLLAAVAEGEGMDPGPFVDCYDARPLQSRYIEDWGLADDLGVRGTPSFRILHADGTIQSVDARGLEAALSTAVGHDG